MVRNNLLLSLLAVASPVLALSSSNEIPNAYMFDLQNDADVKKFSDQVKKAGGTVRMELDYDHYKGMSLFLTGDNAQAKLADLAKDPAVKGQARPLRTYQKSRASSLYNEQLNQQLSQPLLAKRGLANLDSSPPFDYSRVKRDLASDLANNNRSSFVMTQIDKLHRDGITGKGIKIGIVDGGFDWKHPDLGNGYGEGHIIGYGYDLVGDDYTQGGIPKPDPDPMDECGIEGTLMAGVIAAQPNVFGLTGVAPGVTIGAYKIAICDGATADDIMLAAWNRAFKDGSQIITTGYIEESGWTAEPWGSLLTTFVQKGVACIVPTGNGGRLGMWSTYAPGDGKLATAVGVYEDVQTPIFLSENTYTVAGGPPKPLVYQPSYPAEWAGITLPLWAVSTDPNDKELFGCDAFPKNTPDLSKKIVLIRGGGGCNVETKARNALAYKAQYLMLYDNLLDPLATSHPGSVTEIKASSMVSVEQGVEWLKDLAAHSEVMLQMADPEKSKRILKYTGGIGTPGAISNFSSWGPTLDGYQKPQFGAVGDVVIGLYPRAKGLYGLYGGSGMAAAQATGIAALISQVRGTLDPAILESVMTSTAKPTKYSPGYGPYQEIWASVAQQGGGIAQAYDAAHTTTILSVSTLSFNDSANAILSLDFTIKNTASKPVTYKLNNIGAGTAYTYDKKEDLRPMRPPRMTNEYASLVFNVNPVNVPANGEVKVTVTPTPPAIDAGLLPVWSGFIELEGDDGSRVRLPYMGIVGSIRDHVTISEAFMTNSSSSDSYQLKHAEKGEVFHLPPPGTANKTAAFNLPVVAANLTLGTRILDAYLMPAKGNTAPVVHNELFDLQTAGQLSGFPVFYSGRTEVITTEWDGKMTGGKYAPAGEYTVIVKSLRVFGDEKKREDYDSAETDMFKIDYDPHVKPTRL